MSLTQEASGHSGMITVGHLPFLNIRDHQGNETYGAMQVWYATEWQRRAGCGPTVAATLLWYLSQTRQGGEALCPLKISTKSDFLQLMEQVWDFVTPGPRGLNKLSMMTEGTAAYAGQRGVELRCRTFEIPQILCGRPSAGEVSSFLREAMQNDLPVAFLNLSNGRLTNLDNWHWVTVVGFDPETHIALIYDQGKKTMIDLALWLRTTLMGGGFVTFTPPENAC